MTNPESFGRPLKRGDSLVIATHNPGKLWEIQRLLDPYGVKALAAGDLGVPEPEETGSTFEENARLKAELCSSATGRMALADDSGLAVEALDGAPGIYSARWAGEGRDFSRAMERVERELEEKGAIAPERRRASFVCVLCLANLAGSVQFFEGRVAGHVIWPPRGENGFGYDAMFQPLGHDVSFGEMDPAAKHAMSHRADAFAKLVAAVF
jgi:XTP/dITP diphosphohydrolase